MPHLYLLKRTRVSHLKVGTAFILAGGYRGDKQKTSDRAIIHILEERYESEEGWNGKTHTLVRIVSLGYVLLKKHGLATSDHDLVRNARSYSFTWGPSLSPLYVYALEPYTVCVFHSNIKICARRIGPMVSERSKAHLFTISGNEHASIVCSTNLDLINYYHLLTLEDSPTCTRCVRTAENA